MNDFDKTKVGFALALLGTVFTLHPIVAPELARSINLVVVSVPLRAFYLAFVSLLAASVYCFALDMVTGRPVSRLRSVGTTLYAIALVTPSATVALALVAAIARAAAQFKAPSGAVVGIVAAVAATAAVVKVTLGMSRELQAIERRIREDRASMEEAAHIGRAQQMLALGHFDLAALEAWSAIEGAVSAALFRQHRAVPVARRPAEQLEQALQLGVIPSAWAESAQQLRRLRNQAAHGGGSISENEAKEVVSAAVKILGAIARPELGEGDA